MLEDSLHFAAVEESTCAAAGADTDATAAAAAVPETIGKRALQRAGAGYYPASAEKQPDAT